MGGGGGIRPNHIRFTSFPYRKIFSINVLPPFSILFISSVVYPIDSICFNFENLLIASHVLLDFSDKKIVLQIVTGPNLLCFLSSLYKYNIRTILYYTIIYISTTKEHMV